MALVVAMGVVMLEVGESRSTIGDGEAATDQVGKRLLIGEMGEKGRCCSGSGSGGGSRRRKRRGRR